LPEVLEVVGGCGAVDGGVAGWGRDEFVGVADLGAGGRRCDEEEDGDEMESGAHGVGGPEGFVTPPMRIVRA
jgi:hypothetical protein